MRKNPTERNTIAGGQKLMTYTCVVHKLATHPSEGYGNAFAREILLAVRAHDTTLMNERGSNERNKVSPDREQGLHGRDVKMWVRHL